MLLIVIIVFAVHTMWTRMIHSVVIGWYGGQQQALPADHSVQLSVVAMHLQPDPPAVWI